MNSRLRELAHEYRTKVIETFVPFDLNPNALIADDCVHPNDAGYAVIREATIYAYAPSHREPEHCVTDLTKQILKLGEHCRHTWTLPTVKRP